MRLPRTIRLDPSDGFVFAKAAEPGEWAVTGTFLFFGVDPANLSGKQRQAFRAGFLGIDSFGWSTLAVVTEASAEEREAAIALLAQRLVSHCGAPGTASATSRLTPGVMRGGVILPPAPARRAPSHTHTACTTPETATAIAAA